MGPLSPHADNSTITAAAHAAITAAHAHTPAPAPRYGDPTWAALPRTDPRWKAAVFIAAECWREHCSPGQVAADLTAAMTAEDAAVHRRIRGTSRDVQFTLDRVMPGWGDSPSYAELTRRRTPIT